MCGNGLLGIWNHSLVLRTIKTLQNQKDPNPCSCDQRQRSALKSENPKYFSGLSATTPHSFIPLFLHSCILHSCIPTFLHSLTLNSRILIIFATKKDKPTPLSDEETTDG